MARPKRPRQDGERRFTAVSQAMIFGWCQTCQPSQFVLVAPTTEGQRAYYTPAFGLDHWHTCAWPQRDTLPQGETV